MMDDLRGDETMAAGIHIPAWVPVVMAIIKALYGNHDKDLSEVDCGHDEGLAKAGCDHEKHLPKADCKCDIGLSKVDCDHDTDLSKVDCKP